MEEFKVDTNARECLKLCIQIFDEDEAVDRICKYIESSVKFQASMHDIEQALMNAKIKTDGR